MTTGSMNTRADIEHSTTREAVVTHRVTVAFKVVKLVTTARIARRLVSIAQATAGFSVPASVGAVLKRPIHAAPNVLEARSC